MHRAANERRGGGELAVGPDQGLVAALGKLNAVPEVIVEREEREAGACARLLCFLRGVVRDSAEGSERVVPVDVPVDVRLRTAPQNQWLPSYGLAHTPKAHCCGCQCPTSAPR